MSDNIEQMFLGDWILQSSEMRDLAGNLLSDQLRESKAVISYSADQRMAVQCMAEHYPQLFVTTTETKELLNGYHAYCGTYTIDEQTATVAHQVELSNHAHLIGQTYVRQL